MMADGDYNDKLLNNQLMKIYNCNGSGGSNSSPLTINKRYDDSNRM